MLAGTDDRRALCSSQQTQHRPEPEMKKKKKIPESNPRIESDGEERTKGFGSRLTDETERRTSLTCRARS